MKIKKSSLVVSIMLTCTLVVSAQQSGLSIRQLQTEIQKRETLDIPEDLRETNNRRLRDLRAELHTLLEQEIQKLVTYKNNLSLAPDEAAKVDERLHTYKAELVKLDARQPGPMLATTDPAAIPSSVFADTTANPTTGTTVNPTAGAAANQFRDRHLGPPWQSNLRRRPRSAQVRVPTRRQPRRVVPT